VFGERRLKPRKYELAEYRKRTRKIKHEDADRGEETKRERTQRSMSTIVNQQTDHANQLEGRFVFRRIGGEDDEPFAGGHGPEAVMASSRLINNTTTHAGTRPIGTGHEHGRDRELVREWIEKFSDGADWPVMRATYPSSASVTEATE